jgi:hypothetical protein
MRIKTPSVDLNIALINELAVISTRWESIPKQAAGGWHQWNLVPFRPGLVGGQRTTISRHKAEAIGYHPQIGSPAAVE